MKKRALPALLLALALPLGGCSGGGQAAQNSFAPPQEERLVIYTSHKEEVYWPIIKEFEERTGIWVEVVTGGTNELLERIEREQENPRADVMFGGGVESLESYRDCFTPYLCAQAGELQSQFCSPDGLWTPFSALPVVLIYNTKLVRADQLTGWSSLLSPEFQGKIAFADPAISGSSFTALVTMVRALDGDADEVMRLFSASLEGKQLDSSGAVLTRVAEGNDWVGVTLEETALKRIAAGDDIALVYPADGTSCVPDGSALVRGAPHEDNAKLFLDFTASLDVQQLLAGQFYRRSVRADADPALPLPDLEELALVDYDISWASRNRDPILMSWAFYLDEEEALP